MRDATGTDVAELRASPRRRRRDAAARRVLFAAAAVSVVIGALVVVSLGGRAATFVAEVDPGALWSFGWFPRRGAFDVRTIVAGTLLVTCIAMAVATPLGLGAALYLSEYARPRVRRALKPALEMLAGIPSVVVGFFALTWIGPHVVDRLCAQPTAFNMAASGIGVGVLVTPLVASISDDALRAVPASLREASYGLGARRRTVAVRVVAPAAVSGIVAALVVGASRAIGETMVVAIASGATGGSLLSLDPCSPGQTMTAAMAALATGSDQVKGAGGAFESLFFVGLLLFAITLALNVLGGRFVRRVRRRHG